MGEVTATTQAGGGQGARRETELLPQPARGFAWVVAIPIGATVSYAAFRALWNAMEVGPTPLMSIGTSLIGAAIATAFALAGQKPFDGIAGERSRATVVLAVSLALGALFWWSAVRIGGLDMEAYSFPIIGTTWWFIAATSFVGEDAHVADLSPGRRTALNAALWIGGTALVVGAFTWIPPFWFGFVQTLLVTGGFAYILRRTRQPAKSLYAWAILTILTGVAIAVSNGLGFWDMSTHLGPWRIGSPTATWGVFFGLWCGLNYGVLAPLQNWPFSRIRQPWGTVTAIIGVIAWCVVLTWMLARIFELVFADAATALLEAQVWAWHTVFWGFCFALLYGIGAEPYLWRGQRTPGTWDDVDQTHRGLHDRPEQHIGEIRRDRAQ
jgi:predicted membrane protein